MSKTKKESRYVIEQRDHRDFNRQNPPNNYRQSKVEKKIENALRSNNVQDLLNINEY